MAFKKTIKKTKSSVRKGSNKALGFTKTELLIKDATSSTKWGPTSAQLRELAAKSFTFSSYQDLMSIIWKRLGSHGKYWQHVYKSLVVIHYLLLHGAPSVETEVKTRIIEIKTLQQFVKLKNGRDLGLTVRERARLVVGLIEKKGALEAARKVAKKNQDKEFLNSSFTPTKQDTEDDESNSAMSGDGSSTDPGRHNSVSSRSSTASRNSTLSAPKATPNGKSRSGSPKKRVGAKSAPLLVFNPFDDYDEPKTKAATPQPVKKAAEPNLIALPGAQPQAQPRPAQAQQRPAQAQKQSTFDWSIKGGVGAQMRDLFMRLDTDNDGFISGVEAQGLLKKSGVPIDTLAEIWDMADEDKDGKLSLREFVIAMSLTTAVSKGEKMPKTLPPGLENSLPPKAVPQAQVPQPAFAQTVQGLFSVSHGSVASVSPGQGVSSPGPMNGVYNQGFPQVPGASMSPMLNNTPQILNMNTYSSPQMQRQQYPAQQAGLHQGVFNPYQPSAVSSPPSTAQRKKAAVKPITGDPWSHDNLLDLSSLSAN